MRLRGKTHYTYDCSHETSHEHTLVQVLCSHIRVVCALMIISVMCLCGFISVYAYRIHSSNLAQLRAGLPNWNTGGKAQKVIIFAPHCDDETLGCGGLINRLVSEGAQIKVVVATNGDGFHYAVASECKQLILHPEQYVKFGYKRQEETRRALEKQGLPRENVIFLGYPDRGLSSMWLDNWTTSDLYASPYTDDSFSPYKNSYTPSSPYCGEALLGDLKKIIADFKPTAVYFPHPSDQHPDHWALNCYVVQALFELNMTHSVRQCLYIVHRGDWPVPQGLHRSLPLAPPAFMKNVDTIWSELDLDGNERNEKLDAILTYKTQLPVSKRFLISFARMNEIFGVYAPGKIQKISGVKNINDLPWDLIDPCVKDPVADDIRVDVVRGGDIRDIRCYYDNAFVYMRLGLANGYSKRMVYDLRLHGIPDGHADSLNISVSRGDNNVQGVISTIHRNYIVVAIPKRMLGDWKSLMVSADSSFAGYWVDRTAWRLLIPN